jgi:hypothetical protein
MLNTFYLVFEDREVEILYILTKQLSGKMMSTNHIKYCMYSKTCVNRPPLGPRFTAGIDSGPVYSVSTL